VILSGKEIVKRMGKDIFISPFDEKKVGPNSYNVTLADEMLTLENNRYSGKSGHFLDPRYEMNVLVHKREEKEEGFMLLPGRLYLGRTNEHTETHNLVPMLEGRSSIGRLGVFIHATAGFGDIGFKGYWTLEITVTLPTLLFPGMSIGQIYFHTVEGGIEEYHGKYYDNKSVQPSMIWKEFA
jgi:dCTP deaminase